MMNSRVVCFLQYIRQYSIVKAEDGQYSLVFIQSEGDSELKDLQSVSEGAEMPLNNLVTICIHKFIAIKKKSDFSLLTFSPLDRHLK